MKKLAIFCSSVAFVSSMRLILTPFFRGIIYETEYTAFTILLSESFFASIILWSIIFSDKKGA